MQEGKLPDGMELEYNDDDEEDEEEGEAAAAEDSVSPAHQIQLPLVVGTLSGESSPGLPVSQQLLLR